MLCLRSKRTFGIRLRKRNVPIQFVSGTPRHVTTRQHLSSQSRKVTACFVLDDCDDNYVTLANMVDGAVSLSVEPTKQTSSTPIAFNAVDTRERNILNIHTANDDDGPWSSGNEHKSDRNTGLKNGTF